MKTFTRSILVLIAFVLLVFPKIEMAQQAESRVRLTENSDWFSDLRTIENEDVGETQEREVSDSNLRIAGIKLGEDFFKQAAKRLGRTTIVERGDAALGREQACYASSGTGKKVYLIFERGEVSYSFDLFSGGKTWTGQEYCTPSDQINLKSSTASGLRLGLTQQQVIAILGKPSLRQKDQLKYSLHVTKKYTAEDLKTIRENNPSLSDEEVHRNYESYDWSAGFEFRFQDSKLIFIGVSWAETN